VVWFDWCPGCANIFTKKKLLKKTVEKKVCGGYRWVVEELCRGCEAKCAAEAPVVDPDVEVPEPPEVDARIIYGKPVHSIASYAY